MPDLKISQLPPASTPLAGTELVPIVQGGVTDQTTVQAILTSAVPSGTANGVLYLDGSKVVTSGSALTFDGTNLGVGTAALSAASGRTDLTINGSSLGAIISFGNGGVRRGYIWQDGTDLYLANQPNGSAIFITNNAEQMRLNSTGLGIGTNNPAYKLDVRGLVTGGNGTIVGGISFSTRPEIGAISNHPCGFITNNMTQMLLDTSGNLGLGTSSFGTSAAGVLSIGNGTEPSTGPANTVQVYSVDLSAGNTIPAVYCEGSGVTNAGITNVTVTNKIAIKVNGTVYYLLATTNAT